MPDSLLPPDDARAETEPTVDESVAARDELNVGAAHEAAADELNVGAAHAPRASEPAAVATESHAHNPAPAPPLLEAELRTAGVLPAMAEVGGKDAAYTAPDDAPRASDPVSAHATALVGEPQQMGGIEILIQMAEKGEIDPKAIDIIDVTDRFLRAISAVPKENLRQSGKIIFQASVLLRMKAEALLAQKVEDEMGFSDDFVEFDADGSPIIYDSHLEPIARQITLQDLERALVRQTKVRQMRHRRVTLEQLIEALREAERLEQTRSERKPKPRIAIDGYSEMRDMDDILELAHDEDIEDVIARIERLLADLLAGDQLLPLLRIVEALGGRGDWVDAFLAVLFLSNAGKISLQQEQFYGPLFVVPAEPAVPVLIPPPVAPDPGMSALGS